MTSPAHIPPPRAKMALLTWLGIWPLVTAALLWLAPRLGTVPLVARTAVITALLVLTITHSVLVRVADARAHYEDARAHGAKILEEPTDHMYGERQYNAEDPWGHHWTFSQTLADIDPEDWGGILRD